MSKKAQAMLDALMGSNRDVQKKDRRDDEFRDKNCCKHYLVGCCPNSMIGKKLEAIRRDPATYCICPGVQFDRPSVLSPEGCAKLHSPALKMQLSEHKKADEFRMDYEDDLREFLKTVIRETDTKTQKEKEKREVIKEREGTSGLGRDPDADKMCEVCGLRYTLKKKEGGIGYEDFHVETEIHIAYVKLRGKLTALEEKEKERKAAETAKAEERDKAKAERDAEREAEKAARAEAREKDGEEGAEGKQRGSRSRSRQGDRKGDDRERRRSGGDRQVADNGDREGDDRERRRGGGDRQVADNGEGDDRERRGGGDRGQRGDRGDRDSGRGRDRRPDDGARRQRGDSQDKDRFSTRGMRDVGRDYDNRSDRRRGGRD